MVDFTGPQDKPFFACACFKQVPDGVNRRDEHYAQQIFQEDITLLAERICVKRGVVVITKALARWAIVVPRAERDAFEKQLHDLLDAELARHPPRE